MELYWKVWLALFQFESILIKNCILLFIQIPVRLCALYKMAHANSPHAFHVPHQICGIKMLVKSSCFNDSIGYTMNGASEQGHLCLEAIDLTRGLVLGHNCVLLLCFGSVKGFILVEIC